MTWNEIHIPLNLITFTIIFKELNIKTTNSSGNYDFMFGYVMNYSWKLRDDGGYDCSTEIISTGEILESYKINFSAPEISAKSFNTTGTLFRKTVLEVDEGKLDLIKKDYSQNIIRGLCSELFYKAESNGKLSSGVFDFNYVYENNTYSINFISLEYCDFFCFYIESPGVNPAAPTLKLN
jgi:hypothetical protein